MRSSRRVLGGGVLQASALWATLLLSVSSCSSSAGAPSTNDAGSDAERAGNDGALTGAGDADGAGGPVESVADDGPSRCNGAALPDGGSCPARPPVTLAILGPTFAATGSIIAYGAAPDVWDVYPFASAGQSLPSVTPSANKLSISTRLLNTAGVQTWAGVGASIDGTQCLDETNHATGLQFTLSGDLGGCLLDVEAVTSPDESSGSDPCRGTCTPASAACRNPAAQVTLMGTITIPNMLFGGGSPLDPPDVTRLIGFRWRLRTPDSDAGSGCNANVTIANAQLFGL